MAGERFDYRIERQRHESFVGREELLERLDQLLIAEPADRWVLVTGGPGMGKSALLAWWLTRRERAGDKVPHHFIRRGEYDWDDPAKLVGSLVAQLEERFPGQREPDADARVHPAARLAAMLARVSEHELAPRGERLVVLIDGLDEYDPPPGARVPDPLAAFLPHALPRGVSFLCASRPRHPYVSRIEARSGELVRIDLDAPEHAASNDATVREFWKREARSLALGAIFIDEAVARAGGNLQHATMLRKYLVGLTPAQRRVKSIPGGLEALLEKLWDRIATDPLAVHGLGILCAAREALSLEELAVVAGWTEEAQRRVFLAAARELLVETWRPDGRREYRLHHESIREYLARTLGDAALRGHHAALAARIASWPVPADATTRRYALRHGLAHRAEAGDWTDAWRLAADMSFLEAKCRELGAHDAEADVARAAERCRAGGDEVLRRRFDDLARALVRESHWLREAPEATAALVWNRLRRWEWSPDYLAEQLRIPSGTTFLRVRHARRRESPALVRDLVGNPGEVLGHEVTACAVTPDGRRVVSAFVRKTLKLWDLDSGGLLGIFEGHAGRVAACAVMPDGRRMVSASWDGTLKVWDVETCAVLVTLEGHAGEVWACAVTPDGRRVVSGSADRTLKVWDVDSGGLLATFEGHAGAVNACAVTPDGGRTISAFTDGTLKIWDFDKGCVIATLKGHVDQVKTCAVTPDGRRAVSGSADGTLKVWDLDGGQVLATFEGHTSWVTGCAVTPDGRRVVSASCDRTLKVWDLDTGRVLATFEGHSDPVHACAVTSDGRHAVSGSFDKTLKVWDLDSSRVLETFEGHRGSVRACTTVLDGRRVISTSKDGTLKVWSFDSGRVVRTLKTHDLAGGPCAVTPDGKRVIAGASYEDWSLNAWNLDSGRELATFTSHIGAMRACAVTPDARRVVSAGGALQVWDLDSGRLLATFEGRDGEMNACAVTPDGGRVVSGSRDRTLKIWDLDRGSVLATFEGHGGEVEACAVTPDGRRVVSGSRDETLKVWDLDDGRVLATLAGHASWLTACTVTPDGRHVISASNDRTLKVWGLDTHACLFTHRGDAPYHSVAATATGIVAGDDAGTVWFLDWPRISGVTTATAGTGAPKQVEAAPVRRILHLSDLHFAKEEQAAVWYAQLAADLREQQVERLDALVVSGDLVERADPGEYAAARRFLEQLMSGFGLSARQVALVPGNHDASWPLAEQAYRLHRRREYAGALVPGRFVEHGGGVVEVRDEGAYRERLRPFAELYRAVKGAPYPLAFEDQAIVDELADLGICILGLNSAWETDHHFRDRASVHPEALANALVRLGPAPAGQLRIAVFHHPIHGGEDSRIRDAAFLQQLAVHGFGLVLHGHVHKADAELYRHDRTEDGRRIEIVAAGTFGASTREWVPGYPLQYNLLLVGPDRITVETRCRREVNGAWEPDARWRQGPGRDPLPRYFIER